MEQQYNMDMNENINRRAGWFNENRWELPEGEETCAVCGNKRLIAFNKNGYLTIRPCDCISLVQQADALRQSGMYELLLRYSFDNFRVTQPWQAHMVKQVMACVPGKNWLLVCGQSGCGKTHLCTSACRELIRVGQKVMCMRWPEEIKRICAARFEYDRREQLMGRFRDSLVLFIDDLFKTRLDEKGVPEVSVQELEAAFELISYRYDHGLRTFITTEAAPSALKALSEALYSRIEERAGEYVLNIRKAPDRNYRLHGAA